MSTAQIRTGLASALRPYGFSLRGSNLALRQPELEHNIKVLAVRRLQGYFEVFHSIFDATEEITPERRPLLQEKLQGFREPYPASWSADNFDPLLAARQATAITSAFSSLADIVHFYSDRPHIQGNAKPPSVQAGAVATRSLSKAQLEKSLHSLALSIFSEEFTPAQRLDPDTWARNLEVGGFRHCARLVANDTATLASLHYFPFASIDIAKGRKSNEVLSLLYRVPKRILFDAGQPVLFPLTEEARERGAASLALLRQLDAHPPNSLPRT